MSKFSKLVRCLTTLRSLSIKSVENLSLPGAMIFAQHMSILPLSAVLRRPNYGIYVWNGHQVRRSIPDSRNGRDCWFCEKETIECSQLFCDNCGRLRDIDPNINYFDLLNFPKVFSLEVKQLSKSFRDLQSIVHPDKFASKSLHEQTNASEWSSLINIAYKTLYSPMERGQYLLQLEGIKIPHDNSSMDKEFLMRVMERNEEVEGTATQDALVLLNEKISKEINDMVTVLAENFEKQDFKAAAATLVEMKYLQSVQKSIKEKIQKMMNI